MKSKFRFLPFIFIIIIALSFTNIIIYDTTYYIANSSNTILSIDYSYISQLSVYYDHSNESYTISDSNSNEILKSLSKTLNDNSSNIYSTDGSIMYEDNLINSLSKNNSNTYYIEITFNEKQSVNLKNASFNCISFILNVNDKEIYYCSNTNSDYYILDCSNIDFSDLTSILNEDFILIE